MHGLKFNDPTGKTVMEIPVVDRPMTAGRATDVDISLPFKAISRYHARFFPHGNELYVEDLGSSNGVLVGGQRISGAKALVPGDYARIGIINVIVVASARPAEQPPAPNPYQQQPDPFQQQQPDPFQQQQQPDPFQQQQPDPFQQQQQPDPFQQQQQPDPFQQQPEPFGQSSPDPHQQQPPPDPYQQQQPDPFAEAPAVEPPTRGRTDDAAPEAPFIETTTQQESPPEAASDSVGPLDDSSTPEDPETPTAALPIIPRLVGETGEYEGEVVYLDQQELTVGRVKGCSLVVEDASVSRNHAKVIRKDAENFLLFDLRSFNGTFVNDEQVTRQELSHGDKLRFGDVVFKFLLSTEAGEEPKKPKMPRSRKRRLMMLSGAAVMLLLLVIAANILFEEEPPPPPPDPEAEARALKAKVDGQIERAQSELRRRDWDSASATLQGVLKLDPVNDHAVKGLEVARLEQEREGWIEEAVRVMETGRELKRAQVLLEKIPQKSAYYPDARVRLRQVNRTIADEARRQGLSNCRAWRYEECQRLLCLFFQTWPLGEPIPDEVRVRRALERAENRLSRRRRSEFEPCEIPEPGTGDQETDELLSKQYPEKRIRRAVVAYFQGRAEEGLDLLHRLEKSRRYRDQSETIDRLVQQMIRVKSASADVHRDIRAERLEEAESSFEAMEQADQVILPEKVKSHYVREAGHLLGDNFHRVGEEQYRSGRLREAYEAWSQGKRYAPAHPEVLQSLLVLSGRAREACDAAHARLDSGDLDGAASHFELCRDITEPSSALHRDAVAGLEKIGR